MITPIAKSAMEAHRREFLARVEELWKEHQEQFRLILAKDPDSKITLTFQAAINAQPVKHELVTKIRFSESFTDERKAILDDPKQGTFTALGDSEAKGKDNEGQK